MPRKLISTVSSLRLERRVTSGAPVRYRVGAIVVGLVFSFGLVATVSEGTDLGFFSDLWTRTFGSARGIEDVMTLATPLIFVGLAAAIPLRLGLWNVGGEGQLFIGAWAAALVAFTLPDLNGPMLIVLMLLASVVGGAAWMAIPALARVYLGVSEIIGTLLLNFVAAFWVIHSATHLWPEPDSVAGNRSEELPSQSELPHIPFGGGELPVAFLIALVFAAAVWWFVRSSRIGYEMGIFGASPRVASYSGISTRVLMLGTLLAGGAMAGLGGAVEMTSEVHRYGTALSNFTGYIGVIIAALAVGSAVGVVVLAVVFAVISIGGSMLQVGGASFDLVFAMFGLTLVFAAMGQGLANVRLVVRHRPDPLASSAASLDEEPARGR